MIKTFGLTILLGATLAMTGCTPADHDRDYAAVHTMPEIEQAIAILYPTGDNVARGIVTFRQRGNEVHMRAEVTGLKHDSLHGFHIHEYGDCSSADATSAGGHYNPDGHDHGLPNGAILHAGDFGNLSADSEGKAVLELTLSNISISGRLNPILGRGIIVHADPDDGSQPLGNAGARIACGVIGVSK